VGECGECEGECDGELGADFTFLLLPRVHADKNSSCRWLSAGLCLIEALLEGR
jgi:hypothetical protein